MLYQFLFLNLTIRGIVLLLLCFQLDCKDTLTFLFGIIAIAIFKLVCPFLFTPISIIIFLLVLVLLTVEFFYIVDINGQNAMHVVHIDRL